MTTVPVSVVFPYYNELNSIQTTLDTIASQTLPPEEVIFVNSSSTDGSYEYINNWIEKISADHPTKFRNVFKGTDNPASSKNAGIDEASCEWVAFMDCGLIFEKDWIEKQWQMAKKSSKLFISGEALLKGANLIDSCSIAQTYGYYRRRATVPSTMIHTSAIRKAGNFLENRRAGYDAIWPKAVVKSGFERVINNEVTIQYNGINFAPNLKSLFKKSIMYAKPTVNLPYYNIPYYYVAIMFIGLILLALVPKIFLAGVILYLIGRGYVIPLRKSRNFRIFRDYPLSVIFLPIVAIVIDTGRMIGITQGMLHYHIKPLFSPKSNA